MRLSDDIISLLKPLKEGLTLFITIGNTLRNDDGVGPYIAEGLADERLKDADGRCKSAVNETDNTPASFDKNGRLKVINAGNHPENVIDEAVAAQPSRVVIIDAADFGGEPGEARIILEEFISDYILSTHNFPIPVISRLIKDDTGCEVYYIGIQPLKMTLGEEICAPVKETADQIIDHIKS